MHSYCREESEKNPENFAGNVPFTPRNLLFNSNVFNYSGNELKLDKILNLIMEHNYFNSFNSDESRKKNFIENCKKKLFEEPKFKIGLNKSNKQKYFNLLIF